MRAVVGCFWASESLLHELSASLRQIGSISNQTQFRMEGFQVVLGVAFFFPILADIFSADLSENLRSADVCLSEQ